MVHGLLDAADETLDDAWATLHATSPEFGGGLSNHGPMAVEALVTLGHPEAVEGYLSAYVPRLVPLPSGAVIPPEARHAAVGDPPRSADWIATYEQRIEDEGPAAVLRADVPPLANGVMAGALHALIRTGHAVRALARHDTPTRRRELAHALGYWAARHQPMPGRVGTRARPGQDVVATLVRVPPAPGSPRGLIFEQVEVVRRLDGFTDAVAEVDLDALPFDRAVTALVDAAAHLYLSTPDSRFIYLHGITGSSSLRLLGPWLDDHGRRVLLRGTFHALAALHSTYGTQDSEVGRPFAPVEFDPSAAAGRAAQTDDDHTIKLVEALLREHAIAPRAVLGHVLHHRLA